MVPHSNQGQVTERGFVNDTEMSPGRDEQLYPTSSLYSATYAPMNNNNDEETVITDIRATDVSLGLGRIPAGFYIVVRHGGLEWRTRMKRLSINDSGTVEWDEPIPIPSDPSSIVDIAIHASFELQPVLGDGEQLRYLSITVEQLLNRNSNDIVFTFSPKEGNIVSPCSSLSVIVKRKKCKREMGDQLESTTDDGHAALLRYRKYGRKVDLERSIELFELAKNAFPMAEPRRPVAQSNLATAKLIEWLVNNHPSLDVSLMLFRDALAFRPVGHPDRPSTLIQLAILHFSRLEKERDEVDATKAVAMLHEAINLSSVDSYEDHVATILVRLHMGHKSGHVPAGTMPFIVQSATSGTIGEDSWSFGDLLLRRFKQSGNLDDLEHAIAFLEVSVWYIGGWESRYLTGLRNLAMALLYRFQHLRRLRDLERATALHKSIVDHTADSHPDKPEFLDDLGKSFRARFEHLRESHDLERAISMHAGAIKLTPDVHPDRPVRLSNLASAFLLRFESFGALPDLEQAMSGYKDAVDLAPNNHPEKPCILNGLGNVYLTRFQCIGDPRDLEQAISKHTNAVDLTPDDNLDKPRYICDLADSFLSRFERFGLPSDLEEAISRHSAASDFTPDGHPDKPDHLNNLGNTFLTRFERFGKVNDLEQAISKHMGALNLISDSHPDRSGYLGNLGNSLLARFERFGELCDLDEAISKYKLAVELIPDNHPDKPGHLNNLGNSLKTRYTCLGKLDDLELAITRQRHAVDLTPDDNPARSGRSSNLGNSLKARFMHLGDLNDLEESILNHKNAADSTPDGHPEKPGYLNSLSNAIYIRFERLGESNDLDTAVSMYRYVVSHTVDGHPEKPGRLNNLGNALFTRFERLGGLGDLDEAILSRSDGVDLTLDDNPDKPDYLNSLGNTILTRFQRVGELNDLERAILRYRGAVDLMPDGHPDGHGYLYNLGDALFTHYKFHGELGVLEEAISRLMAAAHLVPDVYSDKHRYLSNLGNALRARFECMGDIRDLEHAVSTQTHAITLTSNEHPGKPINLNNLGSSVFTRFECLGDLADLELAITRFESAIDLTPDGHPAKPSRLSNTGAALFARFERLGNLRDLEEAISKFRHTVNLSLDSHGRASYLSNFGVALFTRYRRLGGLNDLEQAISQQKDAINLTLGGHPDRPGRLSNLGNSLNARFEHLGVLGDLEEAISSNKQAVELTSDQHTDKPRYLNNLGNTLLARFEHLKEFGDLEQAILNYKRALDLTPDRHPFRLHCLHNFGNALLARFKLLRELSDLEEAISSFRKAVNLTPIGHSDRAGGLTHLGNAFLIRFEQLGRSSDLEQAISLYSFAACASSGPPTVRFNASQKWISCTRNTGHSSLLHAYSVAIDLLPQLAWIGLSLTQRYHGLLRGTDIVREAAAAALDSGHPETAVEWLEQGRSIIWGELFQLRSSYDELSSVHPDHARRLRELSAALEHAGTTHEKFLSLLSEHSRVAELHAAESLELEADRHRMLAMERDKLLQEIRELPGFERFLLHKEFSQLRAMLHSGPVVILNTAESRCDALIVLADVENVIHVPLPNFTHWRSVHLQDTLKGLVRYARVVPDDDREGQSIQEHSSQWELILSVLWKNVVKPVLDSLAISTPGILSRIFWCPTGPFSFLPIHAAGFYDPQYAQPGHKVFDFVISSYVPTLSILAPSPNVRFRPDGDLRFLAVPQPPSDGFLRLPGVDIEMKHIRTVIRDSPSARTTLLESSLGTVEEVLGMMKETDWVHFACHGVQDAARPMDSGLCLANERRLKLSDIIALSRPHGGLAFLSACQTATGDKKLSDEAMHIAAGMLFAGYGGVVGTMWSINDRLAPGVARDVYEQLFSGGTMPDYRDAARALQDAVGRLRDKGVSFDNWLPFIHVGL